MKSSFFILFFFLLSLSTINAQDLIITTKGDSINCYVKMDKSIHTYCIGTPSKNGINWRRIKRKNVTIFYKDFYKKNPAVILSDFKKDNTYYKWRFAFDLGFGNMTRRKHMALAENNNELKYINLQKGFIINLRATYFLNKNIGIGVLYKGNFSDNEISGIKASITLYDIFPTVTYRFFCRDKKDAFLCSFGLGGSIQHSSKSLTSDSGTTLAYSSFFEVGYDYGLSKNWCIGIKTAFTTYVGHNIQSKHLSFGAGIRYMLW